MIECLPPLQWLNINSVTALISGTKQDFVQERSRGQGQRDDQVHLKEVILCFLFVLIWFYLLLEGVFGIITRLFHAWKPNGANSSA